MERDSSLLVRAEPRAVKEHKALPIDKLKFDPNNVRFSHLSKERTLTQAEMYKILRTDPGIDELRDQIIEAKKVYEELVVDHDFIVKEGNRRLACLLWIKEDLEAGKLNPIYKGLFDTLRCAILSKDADPIDIEVYLAIVHVKGKKPWAAFDKASHIYYLSKVGRIPYDSIVSYVGMSKKTVKRSIDVYQATQNYGDRYRKRDPNWWRKYTYFDELYKSKDLAEWRQDDENIEKFMKWVIEKKLDDVRFVRRLKQVMDDKIAFKQFQENGIKAALLVLGEVNPSLSSRSFKVIKDAIEVFKGMRKDELNSISKNPAKIKMLNELKSQVSELLEWIKE